MAHHNGKPFAPATPGSESSAAAVAAAVASAATAGARIGVRSASVVPNDGKFEDAPGVTGGPRVTVVIPVFNNAELTEKCLFALAANTGLEPDYRVVVVDNGSVDWTMYLLHAMEGDLDVINNNANLGFGAACNQGAERGRASDYVLFLNNDTAPRQHWLEAMVDLADRDQQVGIVGAKLLYPSTGRVQHAGIVMQGNTPEHMYRGVDENDPRVLVERDLDMVTGACLLVRSDLFHDLGGFDTDYVNGVEDVDLCLRVRERGYRVVYCPDAVLEHHEGSTEGRFDHASENLRRFRQKWSGRFTEDGTLSIPDVDAHEGGSPKEQGTCKQDGAVSELTADADRHLQSVRAAARAHEISSEIEIKSGIVRGDWEGDFFVNSSLAHVNRELSSALLATGRCELGLNSELTPRFGTLESDGRYPALADRVNRLHGDDADFYVKHRWPPDFNRPADSHFILLQPWEFGRIPKAWVDPLKRNVDQVWAPTSYVRDCYIDSGIDPKKIALVPQGVDPSRFRPGLEPLLLPTDKSFKFLFVGGTLYRKGIDLLLDAYCRSFSGDDDVCLVIKDVGTNSFYRGMNSSDRIRQLQTNPNTPEIVYLTEDLPGCEMPRLYASADALVHPYRGEGFGLPVAEAMACGLPVIVTRGGACDDFCPEDLVYGIAAERQDVTFQQETAGQAWLLEPDLDSLVEQLQLVVSQPEASRATGERSSDFIRTAFTWEKASWRAVDILQELRHSQPLSGVGGGRRRRAVVALLDDGQPGTAAELEGIFGRYGQHEIEATSAIGARLNEVCSTAAGRDFLFIVSGTQPLSAEFANRLLHHLDANADIAMVVPCLGKRREAEGVSDCSALSTVDYPPLGCPVALRLNAVEAVGGFDEVFKTVATVANMARVLRRQGWRIASAADCQMPLSTRMANMVESHELMAITLLEEGDSQRQRGELSAATATYCRALASKGDCVETILVYADALMETGEPEAAAEVTSRLIDLDPESAWAHNVTGLVLSRTDPARARSFFRTAGKLMPDFTEAHINLGVLEWEEGNVETAFAAFQEVSRLDSANRELAINLALIYAQIDQRDTAIGLLRDYLELHGNEDVELKSQLAEMMEEEGRTTEARELARQILEADPGNAQARAIIDGKHG